MAWKTSSTRTDPANDRSRMLDAFAMDQSDRKGFSLFPMPPTPPANRAQVKRIMSEQQRTVALDNPVPGSKHRDSDVQHLRPPPLKLRKKRLVEANQPYTTSSPLLGSDQADSSPREVPFSVHDVVTEPFPQLPTEVAVPNHTSYLSPNYTSYLAPLAPSIRASSVGVPECNIIVEEPADEQDETPSEAFSQYSFPSKRSSYRKSQWLDGRGELDRKRLSMYLSGILDTSFDVEEESTYLTPLPLDARASILKHGSQAPREPWRFSTASSFGSRNSHRPAPLDTRDAASVKDCHCPPGVIMCKCCSSPEFERFRRVHSDHKPNPSVSSTTCFLSIPRARFRSTLGDEVEQVPDTPSTPPGLMYDSDDSDELDWSPLNSPTFQDRRLHYLDTPTPAARREPPTQRPPVPSFSLPFSHGRQIRPRFLHADSSRTSVPRAGAGAQPQRASPSSSIPTLASISTVSTFTFDFGDDEDNQTEFDFFDEGSTEMSEIRTFEPVQKAKPVLVHCRGPSPQSIKYGHHHLRHKVADSDDSFSAESDNWGTGYATIYVR
ncbi:hypothetical protein LTR67_003054 [Exophiala xenobiotica]